MSYGGGSLAATDGTLKDKISMVTYRGVRVGANQFVIVSRSGVYPTKTTGDPMSPLF